MLYNHFTEELLDLQDVIVKNIVKYEKSTEIHIEMPVITQTCPSCRAKTEKIHGYRVQKIKDLTAYGKHTVLVYRKRRYRCSHCGKCFSENNTFLPKYYRMSSRLICEIIEKLREERSFSSVAREFNLSAPTVIRVFDLVSYPAPKLPKVLAIDEFKGNAGSEKYQCIITDPKTKMVLDILPKRYDYYLTSYFKNKNKEDVAFFVSDMWKPYANIASTFFKDAVQIVDKYHWIRQAIFSFEAVRKAEQKKFGKSHRLYFKRSKTLLTKRFNGLKDDEKQQLNIMLSASATLSSAHFLKEEFLNILDNKNRETGKKALSNWVLAAQNSDIEAFQKCAKTMINWSDGILNSFVFPYTNGFTEGCNNRIKVLKRNAYGYRNFKRFRNRILHIFSHQKDRQKMMAA